MKQIDPTIEEIFQDDSSKYLAQREFEEICALIDIINKPIIIYLPEDELESIEDPIDNKFKEDLFYESI